VQGDAHDEAPRLSNTTRMSEAEALTQLDKTRLQRKNTADDERMDEEEWILSEQGKYISHV